jgi:hypothetical protein
VHSYVPSTVSWGTATLSFNNSSSISGTVSWQGNAVTSTYGGTGQTSYTTGDTLYASASNTLSKLAIGSTGQVLTVSGGVPTWANTSSATTITDDTTTNATRYINFTSATSGSLTNIGTSSTKLQYNPSTGALTSTSLTPTNALGTSYGGTGLTSFTANGVVYASSTSALATSGNLTFNGSSILGVSGTPNSWVWNAIQLGSGSLSSYSTFLTGLHSNNYIGTAGNYYYINSNYATAYIQNTGQHQWFVAPSGTAGNSFTPTQAMTLTNAGYLGIGTSSPSSAINVNVASTNTNQFQVYSNDSTAQARTYSTSDGNGLILNQYYGVAGNPYLRYADIVASMSDVSSTAIRFFTKPYSSNPAEAMRIDSSGDLIVNGTTTPFTSSGRGVININGTSQALLGFTVGGTDKGYLYTDGTNMTLSNSPSGALIFQTNATERMRISSAGILSLGTSSTVGAGFFGVAFNGSSNNGINLNDTAAASGAGYIYFQSNGTTIGSITRVSSTSAVSYNTTSDQRLKIDLGQVTSTNVIDNTIIHDFVWKSDGTQSRGVFAQEAQKVIPQAVKVGDDGEEVEDVWAVDYSKYVPDLIVYCQQLNAEIQSLKAEVATLKGA